MRASSVCINQLVLQPPTAEAMAALEAHAAEHKEHPELADALGQARASMELTMARGSIQRKYVQMLVDSSEAAGLSIVKLPLLPKEVTGPRNLLDFSQLFVTPGYREGDPSTLVNRREEKVDLYEDINVEARQNAISEYDIGDIVRIHGLVGSAQYNELQGTVREVKKERIVVVARLEDGSGGTKKLLLKDENLTHIEDEYKPPETNGTEARGSWLGALGLA